MLRLSFTILVILVISLSQSRSARPGAKTGGGGRRVTTVDPITTSIDPTEPAGKGSGGKSGKGNQVTTDAPETTRPGKGGKAGKAGKGATTTTTTTDEPYTSTTTTTRRPRPRPKGGKGATTEEPFTTRVPGGKAKGKGGKGAVTTEAPETTRRPRPKGGKSGQGTTEAPETTRRPRGGKGGNNGGGAECANALPEDESYDVLLDALFGNNGELVELGAQALEDYENANGPNFYNDNVRDPMDDILATLLDYDFPDTLRILLALQDGTVIYDSSQGDGNTWSASNRANNAERINENHNSRIAILVAQLSTCGVGYEQKLSSSTGNIEYYVAIRVFDQYASFGTVRVSYVDDSEDDTGNNGGAKGGNGPGSRNNEE